jgi:hypothetical protein
MQRCRAVHALTITLVALSAQALTGCGARDGTPPPATPAPPAALAAPAPPVAPALPLDGGI